MHHWIHRQTDVLIPSTCLEAKKTPADRYVSPVGSLLYPSGAAVPVHRSSVQADVRLVSTSSPSAVERPGAVCYADEATSPSSISRALDALLSES